MASFLTHHRKKLLVVFLFSAALMAASWDSSVI